MHLSIICYDFFSLYTTSLLGFIILIFSLFDLLIPLSQNCHQDQDSFGHLNIFIFLFIYLYLLNQPGECVLQQFDKSELFERRLPRGDWHFIHHRFPVPPLHTGVLLCPHLYLIVWPWRWEMMNVQFNARRFAVVFTPNYSGRRFLCCSQAARFTWHIGWCCSSGQGANGNMDPLWCLYNTGLENKRLCEQKKKKKGWLASMEQLHLDSWPYVAPGEVAIRWLTRRP